MNLNFGKQKKSEVKIAALLEDADGYFSKKLVEKEFGIFRKRLN